MNFVLNQFLNTYNNQFLSNLVQSVIAFYNIFSALDKHFQLEAHMIGSEKREKQE